MYCLVRKAEKGKENAKEGMYFLVLHVKRYDRKLTVISSNKTKQNKLKFRVYSYAWSFKYYSSLLSLFVHCI